MSGAQGALPPGSRTATTYESTEGGEKKTRTELGSAQDEGSVKVYKAEDKVEDATGKGGPVFGEGKEPNKSDLGVTGTG